MLWMALLGGCKVSFGVDKTRSKEQIYNALSSSERYISACAFDQSYGSKSLYDEALIVMSL